MIYTYAHVSKVDNGIFYIGKGTNKRAYYEHQRSKEWNEVAKNGFKVEILAEWPTHKEAAQHEKFLIECAKDLKWKLVNRIAGGGIGSPNNKGFWLGKQLPQEMKNKIGKTHTGKKRRHSVLFSTCQLGQKNSSWKGFWVTPFGEFETSKKAAEANGLSKTGLKQKCNGYKATLATGEVKFYPPAKGWFYRKVG